MPALCNCCRIKTVQQFVLQAAVSADFLQNATVLKLRSSAVHGCQRMLLLISIG